MITNSVEALPCLLLPVQGKTLLLPTAAVAEIVPYAEPEILPDVPAWFVGMLTWRGIQIPLTHIENMEPFLAWNGVFVQPPEAHDKYAIAVINRMTKINSDIENQKFRQYPFFAIILHNTPKLVRITRDSLTMEDKSKELMTAVKFKRDIAFMPNLVSFWKIIDTLPSRLQWFGRMVRRNRSD